MGTNAILVINAGSSSIKGSVYQHPQLELVYRGSISGIGGQAHFTVHNAAATPLTEQRLDVPDHERALAVLLEGLVHRDDDLQLVAVGHRVVHGGVHFSTPARITPEVLTQLEALTPLAPLHQPHNIAPIKIVQQLKPEVLQVACFDTAFHTTQPHIARLFALPRSLTNSGIKRYGFHGLSYEYIAHVLPTVVGYLPQRTVVAHLGNGASLCALKAGQSIATTMSFTALDGLPMGTRCGQLDPGVILHLLNQGKDVHELTQLLYHHSGLLGVSALSNDMHTLLDSDAPEAAEAVALFVYRFQRELGSLVAALGGLDALVFTAGIGEHATAVRAQICTQAAWLGIELDTVANQQHQRQISTANSTVSVWVIPTDEEKMIAQHTAQLMH